MNLFRTLNDFGNLSGIGNTVGQNPLFLGLALFNTQLGLSNNYKNTAQYQKQHLTDEKIDRILRLLEQKEASFYMYDKLIGDIKTEIDSLVERESKGLTTQGQTQLYLLLENKKHLKKMLEPHKDEEKEPKTSKTATQRSIDELEDYYRDYMKHKNLYLKTQDADEKSHMGLELKKFAVCFKDIFESMWKTASVPEEKKILNQLLDDFAAKTELK